ncbi:Alpha/Beta hydrolase protein [Lentinula aciculospora]|uniref:Alpha/Beta hydrolase protein n=1 Tax=Lentinula aciculospora TaxID=153920 RepID=A0A9W9A4K7_9AGAR|nr:Alpha/Beta hydrolase protein [Lentinula aciculospora]
MESSPKPIEILFKHADGIDIYMDVYLSPSASSKSPAPILLWWHGGGLLQGTRKGVSPHHLRSPANHNITFVSADYRLAPQFRFPTILSDCADAIKFLQTEKFRKATEGRADPARVILSGSSAGGWLSLLCGLGIGFDEIGVSKPPSVQGVVPIYPITDLEDPFWKTTQRPVKYMDRVIAFEEVQPFLNPYDLESQIASSALDSPRAIFYSYMVQEAILADLLLSDTNIPPGAFSVARFLRSSNKSMILPTYIVHGDQDLKVPVEQSRDVVKALEELKERGASVEYKYEELPGLDHLFDREPECQMEKMYAFIEQVSRP